MTCDKCGADGLKIYTSKHNGELQLCYGCLADGLRKRREAEE